MPRLLLAIWFYAVSASILHSNVIAQEVLVGSGVPYRYPHRLLWASYDPYFAVTSHVYAQAELIRAQGDAAVSFAYARNLNADAYSKELDNWIKELRVYWDRKTLAEQKKLELGQVRQIKRMRYLNDQKWQNSRFWDRLKNHPELSTSRIKNGSALNFMLARLSATSLPYRFDSSNSRFSDDALDQLSLDKSLLANVTLKQGPFKFSADHDVDETIHLWPYILRWDEFNDARQTFERMRGRVVNESTELGQASVASIQGLHQSLVALTNVFHRSKSVTGWVKQHRRYTQFHSADRFLQELDREIVQLEKSGDIRPLHGQSGYSPESDGGNLVSLLCFMNRNGVEFAPASPGGEFAYHNLFVLMRGLYLTVAEEDESLRPANLGELAK
ncbi:hypothetical protein NZK35_28055 [Stieleria sp. ICT_E10.1]|uniref:hypothetical protein n=1 Tax=Stieleria sedimenti TaxID=2976331 RepID=UPI00217F74F1|nr:hypothetical protein [Stieleria sedimenti]MCS7470524.1 hypothetical protein [Stieleria sedimenti]